MDSWFGVRVDKAVEGGLSLGRVTLDNMLKELRDKAESMTLELTERSPRRRLATLNTLREKAGVHEATLLGPDGSVMAFAGADPTGLVPEFPSPSVVPQGRLQPTHRDLEAVAARGVARTVAL